MSRKRRYPLHTNEVDKENTNNIGRENFSCKFWLIRRKVAYHGSEEEAVL